MNVLGNNLAEKQNKIVINLRLLKAKFPPIVKQWDNMMQQEKWW